MKRHIRQNEWVGTPDGMHWYNGYYDNHGRRVEGVMQQADVPGAQSEAAVRMMLTSQVFAIMSGNGNGRTGAGDHPVGRPLSL